MIIGFSTYGSGASGPALSYLSGYLRDGETRNPKPEVVRGDPEAVAEIIDSLPFERRYSSGVLSFAAEDRVTPQIQEEIMNRFESAVFAGLPHDRRSIVWIKHGDKGRTELHFVVPRVDLGTGKSLNVAPPTPASRHLLDTLRESINRRYGFRDPSDPACAQAVSLPAYVAKLAAQAKRRGEPAKPDIRQAITERLERQVLSGTIAGRADVVRCLEKDGFTVTRQGVDYLTVEHPDTKERVRLKGNIFREHFCPQDLQPASARRDPAQLLALDRRLERLVEKRATYHRARYGIEKNVDEPTYLKEQNANYRTRDSIAHNRSAFGEILPGSPAAVCDDALRFNQAAQYFRNACHSVERASQRLDQANRAFARDFDKAITVVSQMNRTDALVQTYGLQRPQRSQQHVMELEIEPR